MSETSILTKELWSLLVSDGGKEVEALLSVRKREDRRGKMKRMLCNAIKKSSLGVFGGKMYFFGGKVYIPIERLAFHSVLYEIMANKVAVPDADLVKLADIYCDCSNVVFSKTLRVSNNVMIFRNGVLDVEKGVFNKTFDKKYVQMWAVDYNYDAKARTFLWYQFINQVLPDKYWQDALQMFLGATFIDRKKVKIEHIMILLGRGANGKSVVQQAVCGVLGNEYVSQHDIGRLCSRGNDGDMAVAEINGKRLNYCTEMEETDFYKKSARLKALISGEGVTARQLYGNPFKAQNIPLLMANANLLPSFNKKDDAMLRRIYVVPFTVSIPVEKQNKTLGDELMDEYPGILNWILEGRQKFIDNGYRLPDDICITQYINENRSDYSPVLKFMELRKYKPKIDGVNIEPMVWVKVSELYNDYVRWCKQNDIDAVPRNGFTHILVDDYGYHRERKSTGFHIAVFGTHLKKLKKMQRENREKEEGEKREPNLLWYKGVAYATSLRKLADFSGVSIHIIRRMTHEGKFLECTKGIKNHDAYDVSGCVEVLKREHIIANIVEKDLHHRLTQDLRYERFLFNMRMKKREWPYRKYDNDKEQLEEGIIVVPDYTTDEEVTAMAKEAGLPMNGRPAYGRYSQGGKGTQKSREDIPTEEEIKKYSKKK